MMEQRIFAVILAAALLLSLAGCDAEPKPAETAPDVTAPAVTLDTAGMFTDRDLDPGYDSAVSITLSDAGCTGGAGVAHLVHIVHRAHNILHLPAVSAGVHVHRAAHVSGDAPGKFHAGKTFLLGKVRQRRQRGACRADDLAGL